MTGLRSYSILRNLFRDIYLDLGFLTSRFLTARLLYSTASSGLCYCVGQRLSPNLGANLPPCDLSQVLSPLWLLPLVLCVSWVCVRPGNISQAEVRSACGMNSKEIILKHALCSPQFIEKGRCREVARSAQTFCSQHFQCRMFFFFPVPILQLSRHQPSALQFNSDTLNELAQTP